ncbi:hypothetical protein GCM10023189_43470 [Nibrella saemangeumensis]|uniref:Uncharacterized protein n=1 Tax=Nibrella saemangeumensis TaxID=1084526 RepID=A0ABP8NE67_9BACT
MLEVYYILSQELIEQNGLTRSGYWATSLEFNTAVEVKLSHSKQPELVIAVRNEPGLQVGVFIQITNGSCATVTYCSARLAADAILGL